MAFKGLSERFLEREKELHQKYPINTRLNGTHSPEPYVWSAPNEQKYDMSGDSRMFPINAIKKDTIRLGNYLKSDRGLLFLLDQQNLQSGNTFTETRIINPTFIIGNVVPYIHVRRPLTRASDFDVSGDQSNRSPGADNKVGAGGRLQKASKDKIVSAVVSGNSSSGLDSLIKLIPPTRLPTTISGILNLGGGIGTIGINQRPELDINNKGTYKDYYSVALWQGFVRTDTSVKSGFDKAASSLRVGDFKGALKSISLGVRQISNTISSIPGEISSIFGGKRDIRSVTTPFSNNAEARQTDDSSLAGRRYFITDDHDADRYLTNSIDFTDGKPVASLSYLNRKPYKLVGEGVDTSSVPTDKLQNLSPQEALSKAQNKISTSTKDMQRLVMGGVERLYNYGPSPIGNAAINLTDTLKTLAKTPLFDPTINETAEDQMLFKSLSMKSRFESDPRIEYLRSQVQTDINAWRSKNQELKTRRMGFVGGWQAGDDLSTLDPRLKVKYTGGRYFSDAMNNGNAVVSLSGTEVPASLIEQHRQAAETLVDLYFMDYVNRKAIPFRAYIKAFSESVNPEVSETQYIGRLERNIVYLGVKRTVNFVLTVYAFNKEEFTTIWEKVNYLTGLCYPAGYPDGFMVPPFVKLTLGDIYHNQPGYIQSLTHNIDDETPWEIEPNSQAPLGIDISVQFSILEKKPIKTGDFIYNVGLQRVSVQPAQVTQIYQPSLRKIDDTEFFQNLKV